MNKTLTITSCDQCPNHEFDNQEYNDLASKHVCWNSKRTLIHQGREFPDIIKADVSIDDPAKLDSIDERCPLKNADGSVQMKRHQYDIPEALAMKIAQHFAHKMAVKSGLELQLSGGAKYQGDLTLCINTAQERTQNFIDTVIQNITKDDTHE